MSLMIDESKHAVVLIPLYKSRLTSSEKKSIINTVHVLSSHEVFIIGPSSLESELTDINIGLSLGCKLKLFRNKFFKSISGYNRLLTSCDFYREFSDYKYMLIVQTDAFVFSDRLAEWSDKGYSYIGAPWFVGMDNPQRPLEFMGVGNGGFSLRRIDDCIRVLSKPRRLNRYKKRLYSGGKLVCVLKKCVDSLFFSCNFHPCFFRVNEDVFWGEIAPDNYVFFHVPDPVDAIDFSFEVEPRALYEMNHFCLPFGCHAWEKYDLDFWKDIFKKHNF